jgi:hypothetical protein
VRRAALLITVALAGSCTDIFKLPIASAPSDMAEAVVSQQPDLFFIPGPVLLDGGIPIRGSDSGGLLPSSATRATSPSPAARSPAVTPTNN